MASLDADEGNVPWGKYTYALEGLATGCYLEGASYINSSQKLRFRVELPARCFVLSVAVKLPNAPESALRALEDIHVERTLSNGEYETVYHPTFTPSLDGNHLQQPLSKKHTVLPQSSDVSDRDSPTSVDQTSVSPEEKELALPRKKLMDVRRAADSLRLTIPDIDDAPKSSSSARHRTAASENDSDTEEFRTLGVVVVGYVRGQTPAPNRIKILLSSSARLGLHTARADRAEVDGLLGLAFLGNRRYRQAAELLQHASETVVHVAQQDAKAGCSPEDAYNWAAELNLLSAYAYFEHMPKSNDGIVRLIHVANAAKIIAPRNSDKNLRDPNTLASEYLDLRTELLVMLEDLLAMLVQFLAESASLAVKLASARMIEFVCEQLGCAVSKHLSLILNQVLRLYPECMTFGPRERAAAASFSYDSMEDCFERLIDLCCRLFPLTEHSVLHKLYDNTLVPVFLDGFHESRYLCFDDDAEEEADELMTAAVAQTLRVIYLVLSVTGADARVPASLVGRILNILIIDNESPRTPLLLRRTALHTWDALCKTLTRSARGNTVKAFAGHIKVLHDYIPRLLVDIARPSFEYGEVEDEGEAEIQIIKEEYVTAEDSTKLRDVLKRRKRRTEIVDRHTLRRLLSLIHDVCDALNASEEDEERYTDVIMALQDTIAHSIANLLMSGLIDVSYHEAIASGNGPMERNSAFEFGDIYTQLSVITGILEQLFQTYWTSLTVLPKSRTEEAIRNTAIRSVLGWCVDRMRHSAPPRGMLKLLVVVVKGLQNDLNTLMYRLPSVAEAPQEITFIAIFRAYVQWFAQSTYEEGFGLMDSLVNAVEHDLMATDLSCLIQGLGDQTEQFQARTDVSLEFFANVVASSAPKRPDLALSSLKALEDPSAGNQRIANGFPKSNRANTGSFSRKLQFSNASRSEPMSKSLYVHVILASCFDRFDALTRASKHRAGPSYMGEKIDSFVEHAALCVRCLHACARVRKHRDYISAVLGDIFSTCLAMQAHNDGRVRLAGFEIFAASLDVLFLAQETKVLLPQQPAMTNSEMAVMKVVSRVASSAATGEVVSPVTELSPISDNDCSALRPVSSGGNDAGLDLVRSNSLPASLTTPKYEELPDHKNNDHDLDHDNDVEKKMYTIFEEGGSCSFQSEDSSPTDFAHEEKGWQMLCAFVHSSLGIGKYTDVVVQRACLEYLKGCMLSALGGKSTGASVIAFEHIELLWEAVNRLIGSPWRALSGLAMWVICTIVNVAIYCSVMVKGKGAIRQRADKLHDFAFQHVFPKAESFLKHGSRETRIWGMRLLEVYIKARDLNDGIVQTVPPPPYTVLHTLDNLKHDWDDEVREGCGSLLEAHNSAKNKKSSSQATSFTVQAQNFMSMKRHQLHDVDGSDSSRIELWFPALPTQPRYLNVDLYCRTLEGFANTEIEGGEETEVVRVEEENDENEEEFEAEYEEDEENYEYDEEERDEFVEGAEGNDKLAVTTTGTDGTTADETKSYDEDLSVSTLGLQVDHYTGTAEAEGSGYNSKSEDSAPDHTSKDSGISGRAKEGKANGSMVSPGSDASSSEEDEIDDFEFATSRGDVESSGVPSSMFVPEVLVRSEGQGPAGYTVDRCESDDDLADEDEVVNVTDEDDILADLDSVTSEEKLPRRTSGSPLSTGSLSQFSRGPGGEDNKAKRTGSGSRGSSPSGPKPELNPDLTEGVHVLRRKGSFTSRPSKLMPSEEGEVPRLARRRSLDVAALSSVIDSVGEAKPTQDDGDVLSPRSLGLRLSRRRSGRASPTPSTSLREAGRSPSAAAPAVPESTPEPTSDQKPMLNVALKKKSSEDCSASEEDEARDSRISLSESRAGDHLVGGGAIQKTAPTEPRAASGISLEDQEAQSPGQVSPNHTRTPNSEKSRTKSRHDSRSSHSRPVRRLPRAPAFLKGIGPQRRIPSPLPIGGSLGEFTSRAPETNSSPNAGSDVGIVSNSVGSNEIPRSKLPQILVQSGRVSRTVGTGDSDSRERKVDRSQRFSRREPLRLPLGDSEEPDKELLDDLETGFGKVDDLGNRMRVGTPTAEALKGGRNLADDQPSSWYKKRAARRDITDSEHYKSLVDQIVPAGSEDSSRSAGTGLSRDGEKSTPGK